MVCVCIYPRITVNIVNALYNQVSLIANIQANCKDTRAANCHSPGNMCEFKQTTEVVVSLGSVEHPSGGQNS